MTLITLHRFGPAWNTFGCISQFVLKIDTYLRMAEIDFVTKSLGVTFAETAPLGKLPYIDHDGVLVADSSMIIDYLKTHFGDPLDASLSVEDRARGHVIKRMVEEHLWWLMGRERWWSEENPYWDTPGMLQGIEPAMYYEMRDDSQRKIIEHGVGAFSDADSNARGREDIDALATLLGQQSFYLGEQPASVDATVYAFLWQIINAPYASALKDAALNQPNLVAYTQRVSERWFADDPMSVQREVSTT